MFFKLPAIVAALAALLVIPAPPALAQKPPATKSQQPDLFDSTDVFKVHITLSAMEFDAMQPSGGGGFPGFGPPPAPPKKPADGREIHRNAFNFDLPWAAGSVTINGTTFEKVGLRYKGNGTIMESMRTLKKSIKIDLDRHDKKLKYAGHQTINLHSGVADPSKARETLGYAAYRAAGVPAPRTALAEVTLTVPGKHDKEFLGLFTIVEQIDKAFLRRHYKTDKGLLLKPERLGGLNYLGDDWERYKTTYQPKRDATPAEQKRVIDFTRFVNQSSDGDFARDIASYLDIDAFLRFMAVTTLEASMDSFFTLGHNYYLYLHPPTNKFHFLPWDLDRSFANFGIFGTPEQLLDLSIMKPAAQNRLADRLLAMPEMAARYRQIVKEIAATTFTKERLLKELDAIETATKEIRARESKAAAARNDDGGGGFGFNAPGEGLFGPVPDMRKFAEKRTESVAAQLAGKSKGYEPQPFGFGPPGGFGPGNQLARPLLEAIDGNKDGRLTEAEVASGMKRLFGEWDADRNGALDQKELADGLQKLVPPPKGGFGGFGGPPKGGFGGPPRGGFGGPPKGGLPPGKPPESPPPRPHAP
jgi:spore coat protein CotH